MTYLPRTGLFAALAAFFAGTFASTAPLHADTVYLKNGAWIDGIVLPRNDNTIQVEIGDVGKIEIPLADVYEIEKNSRTGTRITVPVDSRDLKVPPGKKEKDNKEKAEAPGAKESAAEAKKGEAEGKKGSEGEGEEAAADAGAESKAKEGAGAEEENDEKEGAASKEQGAEETPAEDAKPAESISAELKARIEELVQDLQRQKPQNRVRAERQLKAIGAPAIPFLLPLAKNDSEATRTAVMRLFNEFGDERVVEACIGALLDSNEYVRDFADRALERITLENFGFQATASPRRREFAQQKWAKWWEGEKAQVAAVRKLAKTGAGAPK